MPEEVKIPIRFNKKENWDNKIFTFNTTKGYNFKEELISLKYNSQIAQRIFIDLRPKVTVTSGMESAVAESHAEYVPENNPLLHPLFASFINWDKLFLSINTFKIARGFFNLVFEKDVLKTIINANEYRLLFLNNQVERESFGLQKKLHQFAEIILKDYVNKFYADNEKKHLTRNLEAHLLQSSLYPDLFPEDNLLILKVPKGMVQEVLKLKDDIEKFYKHDIQRIPTIHFDKHLYSPIAAFRKGTDFEEIKSIPVKLNKGETDFITHLRTFLLSKTGHLKDKEIFILRNLSKGKGIGFFIETASFYPDFILWIKQEKQQDIVFVDPKGILMLGNVNDEKVRFCTHTINEIQDSLRLKLKEEGNDTILNLSAYILSVTPYFKVKSKFGNGNLTKKEFKESHILFQEINQNYLNELFEGKI